MNRGCADRSGLASRIEVLEGLIRSHEGLGTGVREMIELIEKSEPGPWGTVIGMIADFLTVKREFAPLIDLALGDWAQRFVVRDVEALRQALAAKPEPFSGRVSFLPLARVDDTLADLKENRLVQLSLLSRVRADSGEVAADHPGMVAPAEQVVSCDHPELTDLPAQLLGRTLIVHDLAAARAIAAHAPGFRLVTLNGELLEPDGTLTVGKHQYMDWPGKRREAPVVGSRASRPTSRNEATRRATRPSRTVSAQRADSPISTAARRKPISAWCSKWICR